MFSHQLADLASRLPNDSAITRNFDLVWQMQAEALSDPSLIIGGWQLAIEETFVT